MEEDGYDWTFPCQIGDGTQGHDFQAFSQPNFPPEIYWIKACTYCNWIDTADLRYQIQEIKDGLRTSGTAAGVE